MSTGIEERERDFFGRHYEEGFTNPAGVELRVRRELRALQRFLKGRRIGRVLSIGCGDAPFECLLARHADSVLGIDISPDGIAKAQRLAAAAGLGNVEFRCATLSELPADEPFDGVVCIGLLHHVPERALAGLLANLHAHLRPGAFFFAREPSRRGFLRTLGRVVLGARYDRYHSPDERELDPEAVSSELRAAGFEDVETGWIDLSLIPGHYLFPRAPRWLMSLFAAVDRVYCATPLARWASGFTLFARRARHGERATTAAPAPSVIASSRLARYVHLDRVNRPYLAWQLDQFRPWLGQRILEVGCGVGGIVSLLGPRERILGLDVDPEVLGHARARFADRPECSFAVLDVAALSEAQLDELAAERFDTVLCINALEHMRDDIAGLRALERLLTPGGTLALLMPAHNALYGPYDLLDGHWRRYDKGYLRTLLRHTRLSLLRMHYFNAAGAIGWWAQYRLLRKSVHGESQFDRMNRLIPLLRPLESWIKPPFGLSLVAVCRRESVEPRP
jgi:2-polyprenyl-3-methyl-5-hydroxy-6-metoxy-1,4-benzoquinol methylase